MPLLDDLLASLREDAPVRQVRCCIFWTAVASRRCGLAATVRGEFRHGDQPVAAPEAIAGSSARELAARAASASLVEASIGVAALNSLLEPPEPRLDLNAVEVVMAQAPFRSVAVVGHFPFVAKAREKARRLSVLEQYPLPGDLPDTAAQEVIPQADIVVITGSALINHTLEGLLRLCRRDAYVMVVGPSTPLSPVLFDHGVDLAAGVIVEDEARVLNQVSGGAVLHQLEPLRRVSIMRRPPPALP